MNPIQLFKLWLNEEMKLSKARIPAACCLSTIGLDNFPNGRFVSLKEILDNKFIITGPIASRKGLEIENNNKVALTFWWPETEKQVRVQGTATKIMGEQADKYFFERNFESQIVSLISEQGKKIDRIDILEEKYEKAEQLLKNKKITRPDDWGGYSIEAIRIELMEFKSTRFHDRKLFEWINGIWVINRLQP